MKPLDCGNMTEKLRRLILAGLSGDVVTDRPADQLRALRLNERGFFARDPIEAKRFRLTDAGRAWAERERARYA